MPTKRRCFSRRLFAGTLGNEGSECLPAKCSGALMESRLNLDLNLSLDLQNAANTAQGACWSLHIARISVEVAQISTDAQSKQA